MNLLAWFNPTRWILLAALAAAMFIGVPLMVHRHNQAQQDIGAAKVQEEVRLVVEAQTANNRALQRAAELKYTVAAVTREKFFSKVSKEVHDAAAPLAACPVPESVRVRLNAAAACARGDSETACGSHDALPDTP